MSVYIARGTYREFGRPKLKISFPNLAGLKKFFARSARRGNWRGDGHGNVRGDRHGLNSARGDKRGNWRWNVYGSLRGLNSARGALVSGSEQLRANLGRIKNLTSRFEFGTSLVIGGMAVIAVLLGLLYLAHFNRVATKGYDLHRLEADHRQLINQYEIANMKMAGVLSLNNMIKSGKMDAMRKPNAWIFVHANTELASR